MPASFIKPRLAIVGCGAVAKVHVQRLLSDGRAELAVFCDPQPESAAALRDAYAPSAVVENDPRAAICNHELSGVVLCSPTTLHHEQARMALDRGLHVLCEKPLCTRREEIVDLIERSQSSGRVFSVSYQRRYQSAYRTARRELTERQERYGAVRQMHIFVCERWRQTIVGTWRDDPAVGAGYFGDAGIHQVDVSMFITGLAPAWVFAKSDKRGANVEIVTRVIAEMTGGVGLAAHFVGDANHWHEDIHFHCEHADLLLRGCKLARAANNVVEPITDLLPENDPDQSFLDAILENKPTLSPPQCALPIFDWTAAVLHSAREGMPVTFG